MSNYTQTTFFAPKDLLLSGNPAKLIKGADVDPELAAIAVAIATKYDSSSISSGPILFNAGTAPLPGIAFVGGTNNNTGIYLAAANSLGFAANGVAAGSISSTGNWAFAAPASGIGALFNAVAGANNFAIKAVSPNTAGQSFGVFIDAGTNASDQALLVNNAGNTVNLFYVQGNGEAFIQQPPAATAGLSNCFQVGYLDAPQNLQAANYTLALTDRGKSIVHFSGSPHTYTIPANASVAFPIGTTIVLANVGGSAALTIAITSDSLVWAPSNGSGSRTLTSPAVATLLKYSATGWLLSGVGIT